MIISRGQLREVLAQMGVLRYWRTFRLVCQIIAHPFEKTPYAYQKRVYEKLVSVFPNNSWAYEQMLSLCIRHFNSDLLGTSADFISCFKRYLKIRPNAIFKWRKQAYGAHFWLNDTVGMHQMMQTYVDAQETFIKNNQLGDFGFRIADNLFLVSYNIHVFMDTHIKAMLLGWQPRHKIIVIKRPDDVVCNPMMLKYWQAYLDVIDDETEIKKLSPWLEYLQDDLSWNANLNGRATDINKAACIVQKQWEAESRKPLLQLSHEDCDFGWKILQELGIPRDAWFVSLHVRDPGCKNGSYLSKDDFDSYRNADIDTYHIAIRSITERGGYVIRVGDPSMKPMSASEKVVDYALSEVRSNRMDVFLFTQCRFFVGVASGPIMTPVVFGVPAIMTNFAPMSIRYQAGNCLFIPKLLWLREEERYATFREVLSSDLGHISNSLIFEARNVEVIDNSPDELNEVVVEMLDRLDGCCAYSDEDERLRENIDSLYLTYSGYGDLGQIGRDFIKKYAELGLL